MVTDCIHSDSLLNSNQTGFQYVRHCITQFIRDMRKDWIVFLPENVKQQISEISLSSAVTRTD